MSEEISDIKDYKWYIVHTQHGYENKVRERIEKRAKENGMTDLIVDIYIPSETVTSTKTVRKFLKRNFFIRAMF
nr:transcription termination/antitermination NusG family protein [Brachyspira hampsonii]